MSDMTINEAIEAGHNPDWCESCETPEEQTEAQRVIEAAAEIFTHFERGERDSEATEAKIWYRCAMPRSTHRSRRRPDSSERLDL